MSKFKYLVYGLLMLGVTTGYAEIISPTSNTQPPAEPVPLGADGSPLSNIYETLTLQDCIDLALANSPQAVAAQLAVQNAQVNLNLAKSQFLPTASAGFDSRYNMGTPVHDNGTSNVYGSANLSIIY